MAEHPAITELRVALVADDGEPDLSRAGRAIDELTTALPIHEPGERLADVGGVAIHGEQLDALIRGETVRTYADDGEICRKVEVFSTGLEPGGRPVLMPEQFDALDGRGRSAADVLADLRSHFRTAPRYFAAVVVVEAPDGDTAWEDLGAAMPDPGPGGRTFGRYVSPAAEIAPAEHYSTYAKPGTEGQAQRFDVFADQD